MSSQLFMSPNSDNGGRRKRRNSDMKKKVHVQ